MTNQDNETTKMTVVIAGRSYPVKVSAQEELVIPNIEKEINDQIRQIQLSYTDRDIQDCLSMVLLSRALEAKNKAIPQLNDAVNKLENINNQIESVLK